MNTHEIMPVERREWWPVDYADEVMPDGRATPSAWLFRVDDGAQRFGEAGNEDWPTWPLVEGQAVTFIACDDLGQALLTFDEDGAARWEPRPPEDTYLYDVEDYEMGGDGPDDLVRNLLSFNAADPGMRLEVGVRRWSEGIPCRFTALDGPPRFVALAPLPDDPSAPLTLPARPEPQPELFGE